MTTKTTKTRQTASTNRIAKNDTAAAKKSIEKIVALTGIDPSRFTYTASTTAHPIQPGQTEPQTEVTWVATAANVPTDAETALQLLSMDIDNRRKRAKHFATLASIRERGDWLQGVKAVHIDSTAIVRDAGHTLCMIVLADGTADQIRRLWLLLAILETINQERIIHEMNVENGDEQPGDFEPLDSRTTITDEVLERIGWSVEKEDGTFTFSLPVERPEQTQADFAAGDGKELCNDHAPSDFRIVESIDGEPDETETQRDRVPQSHPYIGTPVELDYKIGISPRWFGLADQVSLKREDIDMIRRNPQSYTALFSSGMEDKHFVQLIRTVYKYCKPPKIDKDGLTTYGTVRGGGRSYGASLAAFYATEFGDLMIAAGEATDEAVKAYLNRSVRFNDAETRALRMDFDAPPKPTEPTADKAGHPGADPGRIPETLTLFLAGLAYSAGYGMIPEDGERLSQLAELVFLIRYGSRIDDDNQIVTDSTFDAVRNYQTLCRHPSSGVKFDADTCLAMLIYCEQLRWTEDEDGNPASIPHTMKDALREMHAIADGQDFSDMFRMDGIGTDGYAPEVLKRANGIDPTRKPGRQPKTSDA